MGFNTCNSLAGDNILAVNITKNKKFYCSIGNEKITFAKQNKVGQIYKTERNFRIYVNSNITVDFEDKIMVLGKTYRVVAYNVIPDNISQVLGIIKSKLEIELV